MCISLSTVPNPSRRFVAGRDKYFLHVPCGKCSSCMQLKHNDWYVRSYYEAKATKGDTIFLTLTYKNKFLPYFYHQKTDLTVPFEDEYTVINWKRDPSRPLSGMVRGYQLPEFRKDLKLSDLHILHRCFYLKDVQNFITKLRVYISRDDRFRDISFRYFCASEFGDKKGRPHYHLLLYLNKSIKDSPDKNDFFHLFTKSWRIDDEAIGFWSFSKSGAFVNSVFGYKYVAKYVGKHQHYLDKYGITKYLDMDPENADHIRKYLPRHLQSINFGTEALNKLVTSDGEPDYDSIRGYITVDGDDYAYNIPQYYKRKLFYSTRLDTKFPHYVTLKDGRVVNDRYIQELNDYGKDFKYQQLQSQINSLADKYDHFHSDPDYLTKCCAINGLNYDNTKRALDRLLHGQTYYDLAMFEICYKDVAIPHDLEDLYLMTPRNQLDTLRDISPTFYKYQIYNPSDADLRDKSKYKTDRHSFYNTPRTFNSLECFHSFNEMLAIIHKLQRKLSVNTTKKWLEKRRKNKEVKYENVLKYYD